MKVIKTPFLIISILFLISQVQLSSQNIGIGSSNPTSKLHLKSTIQNNTALDLDFETGTIDEENTGGNYDWYITGTDGFNSAKCAKMPLILGANETATLKYGFDMTIGKEVTVSFNIKFDDPSNLVNFSIYSDHFNYTPSTISTWKSFSKTFVSQSTSDVINFAVNANQNEAFPIVHIDNILITYEDGHVLKIEDGTQADGLFLQSDALGQTEWYDLREEVDQKIDDNFQELEFDTIQNALFIESGNGVLISSLKNDYGKSLQLSGSEIIGSPGMSLSLPGSGYDISYHFDGVNRTMDWGVSNESIKGQYSTRWGNYNSASQAYATAWGYNNAASGHQSTSWGINNNATSSQSTAFGYDNTASGVESTAWGKTNEASGYQSTSFGLDNHSSADLSTTWGVENTASGVRSTAWGSNNVVNAYRGTAWGSYNEVSGINSTAWGYLNTISSTGVYATAIGESNLANGKLSFVSGLGNKALTYAEVAIGKYNLSKVGSESTWSVNDMLFSIGNGSSDVSRKNAISILKNGRVGININTPTYYLHLSNNSAAKPGSSSWTVSSDRRLKKDISEFTDGLDIISAIEPVWFTYNGLADIPEGTFVGTIAQELEKIAPYMVSEFIHIDDGGNSESYKAVNYGAMDFVLINAIKEQQVIIQAQQERIDSQQAQIDEIMRRIGD